MARLLGMMCCLVLGAWAFGSLSCVGPDALEGTEIDCANGQDDDGDGAIDCGDTDCFEAPICASSCNYDYVCEPGENNNNCPTDCTTAVCGNAACEAGETVESCPADCGGAVCGNGSCEAGETSASCPQDCGGGAVCGNGSCETGETPTTCPQDCVATPEHLSNDFLSAVGAPPDLTCFDTPDPAATFAVETEISGIVEDFEEGWLVEGVQVAIYTSIQELLADTPYDVSAQTLPNGAYSLMAPASIGRLHFKTWDPTGQDCFVTVEINVPAGMPQVTGRDRIVVSAVTMETVPAILGIQRIAGRGIIAGVVHDCWSQPLEHAAMQAYDAPLGTPGRQLVSVHQGASRNSFYFANGMPVRQQPFTAPEGTFMIMNLLANQSFTMELWGRMESSWTPVGYDDCTGGCMCSSLEIPVLADTFIFARMPPLYSGM